MKNLNKKMNEILEQLACDGYPHQNYGVIEARQALKRVFLESLPREDECICVEGGECKCGAYEYNKPLTNIKKSLEG